MLTKNKRLFLILTFHLSLLLIPLIAMQFDSGVGWDLTDFIIMGFLLLFTGLAVELVLRRFKSTQNRFLVCGAVLFVVFLIWAELAVGIFGSPFAGS